MFLFTLYNEKSAILIRAVTLKFQDLVSAPNRWDEMFRLRTKTPGICHCESAMARPAILKDRNTAHLVIAKARGVRLKQSPIREMGIASPSARNDRQVSE